MTKTLATATVLASLLLVGSPGAASLVAPRLYIGISGTGGTVEITPTPTLAQPCTTYCSYVFPAGTTHLHLRAYSAGGRFVKWDVLDPRYTPPCLASPSPDCDIPNAGRVVVRAVFSPVMLQASATKGGTVDVVGGTSCGGGCKLFDYNGIATLEAHPAVGYNFNGWNGACGARGTDPHCAVRMAGNGTITAIFHCSGSPCDDSSPVTTVIRVYVTVKGPGHVTGPFAAGSCVPNTQCVASVDLAKQVLLQAISDKGGAFRGWYTSSVICRSTRCQFPAAKTARGFSPSLLARFS